MGNNINSFMSFPSDNYDTDTQAFIDAVATLTTAQEVAINDLVVGLKANGTWSKYYAIYPFIGGTASSHKWNLKDPRDLDVAFRGTFGGTWTHDSNGITGDGLTTYLDSHFLPSFDSGDFDSINDYSIGVYSRTNIAEIGFDFGANTTGGNQTLLRTKYTNSYLQYYIHDTFISQQPNTSGTGFYVMNKDGLAKNDIYKNGASFHTDTTSLTEPSANTATLYFGAYNRLNIPRDIATKNYAFAFIAKAFTSTEVSDDYTTIQAYQTTLTRNI